MSLEATMILLDNSNHSLNGDYIPSRWEGQYDAANILFESKFSMHPENSVGVMTMAGNSPKVLVSPSQESAVLRAALHGIKNHGTLQLKTSVQIAQLALKHRQNKNQRQRIVIFVASPVAEDTATLIALAKKMKKNSVSIDVVNLGQMDEEHITKMEEFVKNCQGAHFLNIKPSNNLISNQIIGSDIIPMGNNGNQNDIPIGQNENQMLDQFADDPELAEAIRVSLLEQQNAERQQQEKKKEEEQKAEDNKMINEDEQNQQKKDEDKMENEDDLDEEAILKKAKELSLEEQPQNELLNELMEDKDFLDGMIKEAGLDLDQSEREKLLNEVKDSAGDQDKKDDKKDDKKEDKK